jgi:GUN4-like
VILLCRGYANASPLRPKGVGFSWMFLGIDRLWVHYSGGCFGFSVQVETLQEVHEDWAAFCERVGWQRQAKGDSLVERLRQRIYDLEALKGHLPSAAIRAAGQGKARMRILQRFATCQTNRQ